MSIASLLKPNPYDLYCHSITAEIANVQQLKPESILLDGTGLEHKLQIKDSSGDSILNCDTINDVVSIKKLDCPTASFDNVTINGTLTYSQLNTDKLLLSGTNYDDKLLVKNEDDDEILKVSTLSDSVTIQGEGLEIKSDGDCLNVHNIADTNQIGVDTELCELRIKSSDDPVTSTSTLICKSEPTESILVNTIETLTQSFESSLRFYVDSTDAKLEVTTDKLVMTPTKSLQVLNSDSSTLVNCNTQTKDVTITCNTLKLNSTTGFELSGTLGIIDSQSLLIQSSVGFINADLSTGIEFNPTDKKVTIFNQLFMELSNTLNIFKPAVVYDKTNKTYEYRGKSVLSYYLNSTQPQNAMTSSYAALTLTNPITQLSEDFTVDGSGVVTFTGVDNTWAEISYNVSYRASVVTQYFFIFQEAPSVGSPVLIESMEQANYTNTINTAVQCSGSSVIQLKANHTYVLCAKGSGNVQLENYSLIIKSL